MPLRTTCYRRLRTVPRDPADTLTADSPPAMTPRALVSSCAWIVSITRARAPLRRVHMRPRCRSALTTRDHSETVRVGITPLSSPGTSVSGHLRRSRSILVAYGHCPSHGREGGRRHPRDAPSPGLLWVVGLWPPEPPAFDQSSSCWGPCHPYHCLDLPDWSARRIFETTMTERSETRVEYRIECGAREEHEEQGPRRRTGALQDGPR